MNRILWIGLPFTLFLLAGCQPALKVAEKDTPETTSILSSKTLPGTDTSTPTNTRTLENSPSRTQRQSQTPTPNVIARTGTPFPIPSEPLRPENVDRIVELTRWQTYIIYGIAFNPDGKKLAIATSKGIDLWFFNDDTSGNPRRQRVLEGTKVDSLTYSPDGRLLVAARDNGSLSIWEVSTDLEARNLITLQGVFPSMAFSPDGKRFATGDEKGVIILWDLLTGGKIRSLSLEQGDYYREVDCIIFSPDGKKIAFSMDYIERWSDPPWPQGTIGIWEPATGNRRIILDGKFSDVYELALSPDAKTLAAAIESDVFLFDISTGSPIIVFHNYRELLYYRNTVVISPDGSLMVSAVDEETIRIWDIASALEIRLLYMYGGMVGNIAISPDGMLMASATYEGTVSLWGVIE